MAQDSPSEEITGLPRYGCRRTRIIAWTCGLIVPDIVRLSRTFALAVSPSTVLTAGQPLYNRFRARKSSGEFHLRSLAVTTGCPWRSILNGWVSWQPG